MCQSGAISPDVQQSIPHDLVVYYCIVPGFVPSGDVLSPSYRLREDFRPFAPSVLAEEADDWFEDLPPDGSPYMSLTAPTRPGVAGKVPAVCHVDGSSRLQTVREVDNPLYHRRVL